MATQATRRRQAVAVAVALARRGALAAMLGLAAGVSMAQDTSFLEGPELAERLLHNVVRVHADEHGFGLVVGVDAAFAYVVTARHVLGAGTAAVVQWCAPGIPDTAAAESVAGFDGASEDLALLRLPRPAGYTPEPRALAPAVRLALRAPTWLLGRDDDCGVLPRTGAIGMLRDDRNKLRIDMPGVLGGSSGAPVATGHGIVGMTTDSDSVNITALSIERIAQRVREYGAARWDLVDARNEPPTDPQAAEQDLAEMLNQYLFKLRDAQGVLQQPRVAPAQFTQTVTQYNAAADRFRDSRDKYDGTLRRHWQPDVSPAWDALRTRLWAVHKNFLFVNEHARKIMETGRIPAVVRDRMQGLEPELVALEEAIAQFLRTLSQRRIDHANAPK